MRNIRSSSRHCLRGISRSALMLSLCAAGLGYNVAVPARPRSDAARAAVARLEGLVVHLLEEQAPLRPRTKLQKSIGDLGCFDVPLSFLCFCISLRAILTEMKIVESLR